MASLRSRVVNRLLRFMPSSVGVPFETQRARMDGLMRRIPRPKGVVIEDISIGDIVAVWVTPKNTTGQVLLHFHGGAYTLGSQYTELMLAGPLAVKTGARVLMPHYRLAPEAPHPAAVEDALACYQYLLDAGVAEQDLLVSGLSAGGGLSAALLLSLRDAQRRMPQAGMLISPWLDLTGSAPSITSNAAHDSGVSWQLLQPSVEAYAGGQNLREPLISPIFGDLTGLPPLMIQVGELEILLDDSVGFAEKAKAAGVAVELQVWEGMVHAWHAFGIVPEAGKAIDALAQFMLAQRELNI